MSTAENPQTTTLRFIDSWRLQDPNRLAAELISINKETNRRPDIYNFEVENGSLIDPETKKPVLDFIAKGAEYNIAESLQSWATENEEGIAYWISPKLDNVYPCNKAIIHRIGYNGEGKKIVLNSAILFDAELDNPEELRSTFFTTEDKEENLFKILGWIESVSEQKITEQDNGVELRKKAYYFAEQIRLGVPEHIIVSEMQKSGFLGENPVSCPGGGQSFSQYIDSRSNTSIFAGEDHMGSLEFTCPNGHVNRRPYGQKIPVCTTCGVSVDC